MSVIIRLQNLPWSANASDIRDFFSGQAIPEGGVHIVGGELGDAFIAFSTDEDARLAMRKTGTALKGIQISLLLSSRTEMQKVIETARQQALGMQTYIAPPANIPQPTFQQVAIPPNLPPTQQAHLPVLMQGPPQQAPFQSPNQVPSQHAMQPGFQPHVPSQIPIMHPSIPPEVTEDHVLMNAAAPGIVLNDQMSQQHRSYNQQTYQTQIPQYAFQRPPLNTNFHPGVISPNVNSNQFYGQPPVGVVMPGHLQNSPDIGSASPSNNSTSGSLPKAPTPSVTIPQGTGAPEKIDKRSTSTSSKEGRDKRDSKGKDERRRHSKSRSRSRDRDRRRRHRSRSRSRSRDRSGRRRRSRSKERKERDNRERSRDDRTRSQRDRNERGSYNEPKPAKSDGEGGIPGLGEIPDDIPKEGLSIFSSAGVPSQAQGPITSSNEWPQREMKNETEIQEVTMEDAISDEDKSLPKLNLDQTSPLLQPPGFMGAQAPPNFRGPPFQNSYAVLDNIDRSAPQANVGGLPKVWDTPPMDPRQMRPDVLSQKPQEPFMDQNGIPQRPMDLNQQGPPLRPHSSVDGVWNRPHPGRNEWERPRNEQWNNNSQNGNWNMQQSNDNWENPAFGRMDDRNRTENKNLPPFIPDGMRNRTEFNSAETDRNRPPFEDRINPPLDNPHKDDRNRPPLMRDMRNQPFPDQGNIRSQAPPLGREGPPERGDWKRQRNEGWNPSNSSSTDSDRWNKQPRNETWEKPPFPRANEHGRSNLLPDGNRGSRPPLIADEDRIKDSFGKEHRSPIDKGLDNKKPPYNERSGPSREEERNRPPILRDQNKPFAEKESRGRQSLLPSPNFGEIPPLMGDDFELINSPSPGLPEGDRRDAPKSDHRDNFREDAHRNSQRSRFDHQDREGPWNNERDFGTPSFSGNNFRDFHGGRRGGFGGREGARDHDGPGGFGGRDSHFRGRHDNEMGYRGRGRGGFMRGGRMNGPPYPPRERTPCVEILHLGTNIRHGYIKDFFVGAGIMVPSKSIKLLADKHTRNPLGVALLKFGNTRDAFEATKLTGACIYNSCVEINLIDESLYNEMKDIYEMNDIPDINSSRPSQTEAPIEKIASDCICVKGLPVGCTDHDVAKVFDKFKVSEVVLELEKGGRCPSGRCFVRFNSSDEANHALKKTESPNIDGKPLKIMPCKIEELEAAKKEKEKLSAKPNPVRPSQSSSKPEKKQEELKPLNSGPEKMSKDTLGAQKIVGNRPQPSLAPNNLAKNNSEPQDKAPLGDLLTDSVVLKNVSPDVTEVCIRDFFSDEGLIPEKIYFNKPDSEGKTDVFVIFPKTNNARKAASKSSQLLRGTPVTIELINKPAVMNAMGLPFNPLELFKKGQSSEETEEKSKKLEVKKNNVPITKKPLLQNPTPSPGSKPILSASSKPQSGENIKSASFPHKSPPGSNFTQAKTPEPPPDFGKPGCVIALSNVPYNATTEDILEFFKEFSSVIKPENIIRRYDELNRPTPDARVAFPNSNFAIQAVKKLDRKILLTRTIKLCIVK